MYGVLAFLSQPDLRRYPKWNISENSNLISTNTVSNETLSLHLLILRKKCYFFQLSQKKYIFFNIIFFLFSAIYICSILTNEVSIESFWYPLYGLSKKKSKKIKVGEIEKNRTASGLIFFYENITVKGIHSEVPMPKLWKNLGLWILFSSHICEYRTGV